MPRLGRSKLFKKWEKQKYKVSTRGQKPKKKAVPAAPSRILTDDIEREEFGELLGIPK